MNEPGIGPETPGSGVNEETTSEVDSVAVKNKTDLLWSLEELRGWHDEIPKEKITSNSPDARYKVRKNWFAAVIARAENAAEMGLLSEQTTKDLARIRDKYVLSGKEQGQINFAQTFTTSEEIAEMDRFLGYVIADTEKNQVVEQEEKVDYRQAILDDYNVACNYYGNIFITVTDYQGVIQLIPGMQVPEPYQTDIHGAIKNFKAEEEVRAAGEIFKIARDGSEEVNKLDYDYIHQYLKEFEKIHRYMIAIGYTKEQLYA